MPNPAIVQVKNNDGAQDTFVQTIAAQFDALTAAGNAIVGFFTQSDFAGVVTNSVTTDARGNTYTLTDQADTAVSGGAQSVNAFVAQAIAGDPTTPDIVTNGYVNGQGINDWMAAYIVEVSNVITACLVGHNGRPQNALAPGTDNATSGNIVLSAAQVPALILGLCMNTSIVGAHPTPTAGTNMTPIPGATWTLGFAFNCACAAWRVVNAAGTYQAVFNQASAGAEDMATVAVALQGTIATGIFPLLPGQRMIDPANNPILRFRPPLAVPDRRLLLPTRSAPHASRHPRSPWPLLHRNAHRRDAPAAR